MKGTEKYLCITLAQEYTFEITVKNGRIVSVSHPLFQELKRLDFDKFQTLFAKRGQVCIKC